MRPLPEHVTRSLGMARSPFSGCASRIFCTRSATIWSNSSLAGLRFEGPYHITGLPASSVNVLTFAFVGRPHIWSSSENSWPTSVLPYFTPSTSMMDPFAC